MTFQPNRIQPYMDTTGTVSQVKRIADKQVGWPVITQETSMLVVIPEQTSVIPTVTAEERREICIEAAYRLLNNANYIPPKITEEL